MIPRHESIGEGVLSPTEPDSTEQLFREIQQQILDLAERGGFVDVFGGGLTTGEIVWTPQAIAAHFQVHPGRVDFEVGNDGPELSVPLEFRGRDSIP